MNVELANLFEKIQKIKNIKEYREFQVTPFVINAEILHYCRQIPQVRFSYNCRTGYCDRVGVIDINDTRYIDFNDDIYDMTNKGINVQTPI